MGGVAQNGPGMCPVIRPTRRIQSPKSEVYHSRSVCVQAFTSVDVVESIPSSGNYTVPLFTRQTSSLGSYPLPNACIVPQVLLILPRGRRSRVLRRISSP